MTPQASGKGILPTKGCSEKEHFLVNPDEEIVHEDVPLLRQSDPEHPKQAEDGVAVPELCREHGMSSATFYKRRAQYGVVARHCGIGRAGEAVGLLEGCIRERGEIQSTASNNPARIGDLGGGNEESYRNKLTACALCRDSCRVQYAFRGIRFPASVFRH